MSMSAKEASGAGSLGPASHRQRENEHHSGRVHRLSDHLRRYLLVYSVVAIGVGWLFGLGAPAPASIAKNVLPPLLTVIVFFMIYPMMVHLRLEALPGVAKKPKATLLSLVFNFVVTPLVASAIAYVFIPNPLVAVGFFLVMLIPGSSMSLGYTGLAEGNIELATIALGVNFLLILVVLPLEITVLGHAYSVATPLGAILQAILTVLVLPMIVGDLTRRGITRWKGPAKVKELKPLLSSVSMTMMFAIVGLIFYMQAKALLKQWTILIPLLGATVLYIAVMLLLETWLDRKAGLSYEDHMAIVFLSTGKNNGTAVAIAVLAMSPLVAIPAATLPIFQVILLVSYVNLAGRVRRYFCAKATARALAAGRPVPKECA